MAFNGLEGIVVGVFERCAIVHSRDFGRVLIDVAEAPKMLQLGDWCSLEADYNTNERFKQSFKWARTCPFICVKMPTKIPPILSTRLLQNKNGASYSTVSSPILIGTVKKAMSIGWSPQLGRIHISSSESLRIPTSFSTGDCFEGIVASVLADEDVNGCCQWALRTIGKPTADDADWTGVRELRAVYHCFKDGLCILKADDGSFVSFGIADFVEEHVTSEIIESYHTFTVWAGPALVSGDPVRAFLIKPSDDVQQASNSKPAEEASSPLEQSVEINQPASIIDSPSRESCNEPPGKNCKGKELIKRLLAGKDMVDLLYTTDKPLLQELITTAMND